MALIDEIGERLEQRVYAKVYADPQQRAGIVSGSLQRLRPRAVREGAKSMDPERSRLARRLLRRSALPAPLSLAEHDRRAVTRRVARLREAGVEVVQDDSGRWLRKDGRGRLKPLETQTQLVQIRVARAHRVAVGTARRTAIGLGIPAPPARGRFNVDALDPRVADAYRRRLALECSRIAHDALLDDYRDAAVDRGEQIGVGWVRECEPDACGACLALADGRVHQPSDRRFYRHTRCRCRPRPANGRRRPKTGRQIFDSLTPAAQDRLFHGRGGAAKAQLLRDGVIELSDLVQVATDRVAWTDYVVGETPLVGLPATPD